MAGTLTQKPLPAAAGGCSYQRVFSLNLSGTSARQLEGWALLGTQPERIYVLLRGLAPGYSHFLDAVQHSGERDGSGMAFYGSPLDVTYLHFHHPLSVSGDGTEAAALNGRSVRGFLVRL